MTPKRPIGSLGLPGRAPLPLPHFYWSHDSNTMSLRIQTEQHSYLHAASSNRLDDEIDNIFGYMIRFGYISSNCLPGSEAKVSYILQPLPLSGFFTLDLVKRQIVITVVRWSLTTLPVCWHSCTKHQRYVALMNIFMCSNVKEALASPNPGQKSL